MTQEQLAGRLNVSTAAVSKWEARGSYSDMSLLCPLAMLFWVSTDELLGYSEAKAAADIDHRLAEYDRLHRQGDFESAAEIIRMARRDYPQSFRIMAAYMKEIALSGQENLLSHRDELTGLHRLSELAVTDAVLADCLQSTYGTLDPAAWEADRLLHSPHRRWPPCAATKGM